MIVSEQKVVSIKYIMRNSAGEELENTMYDDPLVFLYGTGKILPELEKGLIGMQPGDKKSFTVYSEDVAGTEGELHFEIEIKDVRKATEEEINAGRAIDSSFPDDESMLNDQ